MQPARETPGAVVLFIFTTFPLPSETFLQREMRILRARGLPLRMVSLWGGASQWEGMPVECHGLKGIAQCLLRLPVLLLQRPRLLHAWSQWAAYPRASGWLNWAEMLLGLSYALRMAGHLRPRGVAHIHAVWASAPASAALAVHQMDGIPFSFGAHAYDLFERGGDGWLPEKIGHARWMRSSTRAGERRLKAIQASSSPPIHVVRRGLEKMPPWSADWSPATPLRLLSVGRMVRKMAFHRQIPVLRQLQATGRPFAMTWIGDGPLRAELELQVKAAGLADSVVFAGWQPYSQVERAYQEHDILLFTGEPDNQGNRAGLPNAVAEAMAWGLPVVSTRTGAVAEAIEDGVSGFLWRGEPEASPILRLMDNPTIGKQLRAAARAWTEKHYLLPDNLSALVDLWQADLNKRGR